MQKNQLEWRTIDNHPNYLINKNGEIKNVVTNRLRKATIGKIGYLVIALNERLLYVHRLVAIAFLEKPISTTPLEVNHKNKIRHDARLENLEWVTSSQNKIHSYANGQIGCWKGKFGDKSPQFKNIVYQISFDGFLVGVYNGTHEAFRSTSVPFQNISKCIHGHRHSAGGYLWTI